MYFFKIWSTIAGFYLMNDCLPKSCFAMFVQGVVASSVHVYIQLLATRLTRCMTLSSLFQISVPIFLVCPIINSCLHLILPAAWWDSLSVCLRLSLSPSFFQKQYFALIMCHPYGNATIICLRMLLSQLGLPHNRLRDNPKVPISF